MNVVKLTNEHQEQYSNYVAAHPSGSFLQSWSWGEFQTAHGKEAIRYGVFENKALIAAVQIFQSKIPKLPGFYLYAPYGPLINEVEEQKQKEIIEIILLTLKTDFANAWFLRFEPKDELLIDGKPTLHIQPGSTLITDISLSQEGLLANMHQKTRYNIKVAAKHGVSVQTGYASDDAINLLVETSKRQSYKSHSALYYNNLIHYFQKQTDGDCKLQVYQAFTGQLCIATAIMIDHGATRTYLFGGSDNTYRSLMAPYALHWQAMRDAQAAGLTAYDWWGTETASGAMPGFVQFKLRWGGVQKFYAGARDVVLNSPWYFAYKTLRKVNRLM